MTISLSSIPAEISLYLLLNSESVSDSIGYLKISNSLNPYYHPISAVLYCEIPRTLIIPYKLLCAPHFYSLFDNFFLNNALCFKTRSLYLSC